jgi:imidazolonepropionase-like amidohydrolase
VATVAHEAGLMLSAHTSGEASARACLAAGVDSMEHGFFLERETLELMARKRHGLVAHLGRGGGSRD